MPQENRKVDLKLDAEESTKISPAAPHEEYEHACISLALNNTIEKLRALKKDTEVEVASRLLSDLNDRKVTLIDAERIHGRLQKVIEDSKVSKQTIMTSEAMARLLASILAVVSSGIVLYMTLMPKQQTAKSDAEFSKNKREAAGSVPVDTERTADPSPTDWQFPPLSKKGRLRSINDKTATAFHLTNKTEGKVKLFWINYEGTKELMGELAPEESQDESTFATHVWLVEDSNAEPLILFVAGKTNQTIDVTKK